MAPLVLFFVVLVVVVFVLDALSLSRGPVVASR